MCLAAPTFTGVISLLKCRCRCYYHLPYRVLCCILLGSSTISRIKIHRANGYPATLMTRSKRNWNLSPLGFSRSFSLPTQSRHLQPDTENSVSN